MSFDVAALEKALANGPVARVVVTEVKGSAPREVGASMLVWSDGQVGTIGGGRLELEATELAKTVLATGKLIVRRFPLGPDLGQCCGGSVQILIERYTDVPSEFPIVRALGPSRGTAPQVNRSAVAARGWFVEPRLVPSYDLWIWGAGHVGCALVDIMNPMSDVAITWVDTSLDRFPNVDGPRIMPVPDPTNSIALVPRDGHHIIVTHSHDLDFKICDGLLAHGFSSAGLIGSATKWSRFRKRLIERGHSARAVDAIDCPIGNPALGRSPQAIAIGVGAELLLQFSNANPLRQTHAKG